MASGRGYWQQQYQQHGHKGRGGGRHPHMTPRVRDSQFDVEETGELPSVDDLEVAAAAAHAAAADPTSWSQVSQYDAAHVAQLRAMAAAGADTSSSEEDSDEEMEVACAAAAASDTAKHVTVSLTVEGDHVHVGLRALETEAPSAGLQALKLPSGREAADGGAAAGSDDEGEPEDMQVALEKMIAGASDEEGEKGALGIDPEVLPPLAAPAEQIVIDPSEPLLPAGAVSAMVEGMIVVQARELIRALDIESVLCLTDRTPLGRVEEVLGPVSKPLYALRYAGPGKVEDVVRVGAAVCVAESRAVFVNAAAAQRQEARPVFTEDGEDDEVAFSDDEQEQEWLRQQGKRAAAEGASPATPRPAKSSSGRGQQPGGRGGFSPAPHDGGGGVGEALSNGGRFGGRGGRHGGRHAGGGRNGSQNFVPDSRSGISPGGPEVPLLWSPTPQHIGGRQQQHLNSPPPQQLRFDSPQPQRQQQRFGALGVQFHHQQFQQPQRPQQQLNGHAGFSPQHSSQQQGFGSPLQFQVPPGMQLVPLPGGSGVGPPPQQPYQPQRQQQWQQQHMQQPPHQQQHHHQLQQPAAPGFQPVLLPSGQPAMVLPGVPLTLPTGGQQQNGQQQPGQPPGLYSSGMR